MVAYQGFIVLPMKLTFSVPLKFRVNSLRVCVSGLAGESTNETENTFIQSQLKSGVHRKIRGAFCWLAICFGITMILPSVAPTGANIHQLPVVIAPARS
jgi:hypothetical protein